MFAPDFTHMQTAAANRKPGRLPLYEHIVSPEIMERVLDVQFAGLFDGDDGDLREYFRHHCEFFRRMGYDTVSFEAGIVDILPDTGAIYGGRPGPVQNREDYEHFPWTRLGELYWEVYDRQFAALSDALPEGMKAVGGVGNGVFEISEDLVGYEYLSYMQVDDPELFAAVYRRIGELMSDIWSEFLARWGDDFVICRVGDDLGYKTGLLVEPDTVREHILPQYRKVIETVHAAGKPFLWHSCGRIFEVMDDFIELGIDIKHSNEDVIAPFDEWIGRYGGRIALFGGIDMDLLCRESPDEVRRITVERGGRYRDTANGYALGSGNSIPDYVPVEGYLAMIDGARELRAAEHG